MVRMDTRRELFMIIEGGRKYTVNDILALPEGERAELIDGHIFMMASPTNIHQSIVMWISASLFYHIQNKRGNCRVYTAPFAVFLKNDKYNYVEPDILVICDRDKLDDSGCHGAPDWCLEIVSPSSEKTDYERKVKAYKEAGVREYWIIDPSSQKVTDYLFRGCEEEKTEYTFNDTISSGIMEDLHIDLKEMSRYISGAVKGAESLFDI